MPTVPISQTQPNNIHFTLIEDYAVTSGVIYDSTGTFLIRTLWSNVPYKAGTYSIYWDGLDDNDNPVPFIDYQLKVSANNNSYVWEGVIGNNSTFSTGSTVHRYYGTIACMREVGLYMYYGTTFCEGDAGQWKLLKSQPLQKIRIFQNGITTCNSKFNCANANFVYWGSGSYTGTGNFIIRTAIPNDTLGSFSAGVSYTDASGPMRSYPSVIDLNTLGTIGYCTGIDVQQSGSQYLFVSHGPQNVINVFLTSDGSGTQVQTITIANPGPIFLENDSTLWVSQGTTLTKYTVNSDGTITITGTQITGFTDIVGLSIFNGDIAVEDGQTEGIIKHYDSTTLANTLNTGIKNGYATSQVVQDNKFYIYDLGLGNYPTGVAHQNDGSLWVLDTGNFRYQHFNSSGNFIDNIMCMPRMYCVNVCANQNTQIFANFLEYTLDYNQPLANGWILINNWGYSVSNTNTSPIDAVALLSGHRYMMLTQDPSNTYQAELTNTGLRLISTPLPQFSHMDDNGDLYNYVSVNVGGDITVTYNKQTFLGLDGSNNPIYSSALPIAILPVGIQGPKPLSRYFLKTLSGKIILLDPQNVSPRANNLPTFHLGAYDTNTFESLWVTCKSTFTQYSGDYITNGTSDVGNTVNQNAWGTQAVIGNNIFANYHGEFWKQSQTGFIYHYDDNGILQAIFGVLGLERIFTEEAIYGFASNTLRTNATKVGADIYVFQNDESRHSGIHVWHISNLNSTNNQTIPFTLSNRQFTVTPTKVDLLALVPDNQQSVAGTPGFFQFPVNDVKTGLLRFYTTTRKAQYDFNKSPDIMINAVNNGPNNIHYFFGMYVTQKTGLNNWCITGILDLSVNSFTRPDGSFYITLVDINDKVLVRLDTLTNSIFKFNGVTTSIPTEYYGASEFAIKKEGSEIYLLINIFGQWISDTQPIYDNTADIFNPKAMIWNFDFTTALTSNAQYGIIEAYFEG